LTTLSDDALYARDAVLVNLDGAGDQIVVVGVERPVDGNCLFAFDVDGNLLWPLGFTTAIRWPDCAPPTAFRCSRLVAADLDGHPGDELIVAATHPLEYPCQLSVVDPRTRQIGQTFWHMGWLEGIRVEPNLLGPDHPGLLVWGQNNVLDGFSDGLRGEERQFADWDKVHAFMILDPGDMEGVGPPFTDRIAGLTAAPVRAYAFLDSPPGHNAQQVRVSAEGRRQIISHLPMPMLAADVFKVNRAISAAPIEDGVWFEISLREIDKSGEVVGGAYLVVDSMLHLRAHVPGGGAAEAEARALSFWQEHWRVIVREGEYLTPR
jgi:hypothetical protein